MNDTLCRDLLLLRQRIEALYSNRPEDEVFQDGLNFAVSGIEQAMGAAGGEQPDDAHPDDSINGIESSLAELHIRLDTRNEGLNDDPAQRARLVLADHLLAQACALLAID